MDAGQSPSILIPKGKCSRKEQNLRPTYIQIRQWVRSWTAHLGNRATPEALVDVINRNKKKVNAAILLRDEVKREFNLEM